MGKREAGREQPYKPLVQLFAICYEHVACVTDWDASVTQRSYVSMSNSLEQSAPDNCSFSRVAFDEFELLPGSKSWISGWPCFALLWAELVPASP